LIAFRQHLANLGVAASASHLPHEPRQRFGLAHPFARLALVEPTEINELHVERNIRLVYPARRALSHAAKAFLEVNS